MTPLQAIRKNCLDCMCGNAAEVARCVCPNCPLYPFRFGHNPNRKGLGNANNLKGRSQREDGEEKAGGNIDTPPHGRKSAKAPLNNEYRAENRKEDK